MYLYNIGRSTVSTRWFHPLLLLIWLIIGIGLRLQNLTAKPPWIDEFATLVFSLGNSFLPVPLDQAIAPDILLQPLQLNPTATIKDVTQIIITQDTHPPLYFVMAHLWMKLFPNSENLVSLWAGRSLPALIGALSIPCAYLLGKLAFRSRLVGQISAAMITVSPYGIFIAQEARHYSLAIIWVMASLICLVIATRHLQNQRLLPFWLIIAWVGVNALGIATHYFFVLTLGAEALALIFVAWEQHHQGQKLSFLSPLWWRIYVIAAGTGVAALVWLPSFLDNRYRSSLTEWIQGTRSGFDWISPIFQAIATWLTMISLLPVEATELPFVILSGFVMLVFFIWGIPILVRGINTQLQAQPNRLIIQVISGVVLGAIAYFFLFTYVLGIDLTRGARYSFVYFPAVMIVVSASLAVCFENSDVGKWGITGKKAVMIFWLMGLISSISVTYNLGYRKYYRPDLLVPIIVENSSQPVLISTTHKSLIQTGEMMGIAWELKFSGAEIASKFLLAHQEQDPKTATVSLDQTLKEFPRPFDLWLVNFRAPTGEEVQKCDQEQQDMPAINGYKYQHYRCP